MPVYHLDNYFWLPGWVERDKDEFRKSILEISAKPKWIMDGNFKGTFHIRLPEADTIIFLDYNRFACEWNVLKRYLKYRGRVREDLAEGCFESIDFQFLKWVWDYPKRTKPIAMKVLESLKETKRIIMLKSRKETERLLSGMKKGNFLKAPA